MDAVVLADFVEQAFAIGAAQLVDFAVPHQRAEKLGPLGHQLLER